jgi:hypothetical protein
VSYKQYLKAKRAYEARCIINGWVYSEDGLADWMTQVRTGQRKEPTYDFERNYAVYFLLKNGG